ncbi:MAG: 50S ribosomal protein L13 [Clostridiales bacterium]|nr:50S ribosomal protein L13 [Clostridiales bacterium]
MSTYMPKAQEINRKWYLLDAAGKPLGRVAAQAAILLRGKHRPYFTPHTDCGDHVVIINADKVLLTGNKLEQKIHYRHSGYIGNLKEIKYSDLMQKRPERAVELAVKGMLPSNTLGRKALTRLRITKGTEHKHTAQQPEEWAL